MERSLDLGLLTAALAGRTGLPTAEQLQDLMGEMEVGLFLRRAELGNQLLEAAWYLHAVASVDQARDRYTPQRQRQAFQVSAHIFDLALQQNEWTDDQRLSLGFAAAIGYRRGDRDPNATAIMNRLRDLIVVDPPVAEHVETLPLEAGLAFLGFQPRLATGWFRTWRRQLDALASESALDDLGVTVLGPAQLIVLAADDLLAYFTNGTSSRLARGRARLLRVITEDGVPEDVDARWVAAHLLALSDEAFAGSLWNPNVIPPDVPRLVRQAFTIGSPPVLTLWEPQRDLLTGPRSPFGPDVRRMVLAVPTSGGKTLLAQLLATEQLERTGMAVCYVAPTRSLCREVRQAMSSRVRILQKETGTDKPDFPFGSFIVADILAYLQDDGPPPDVEVMTPERLANLLRHDPDGVLARFGMFIFDEAQHLKESGRGFVLESIIAMLDYLTADTEHRIVLISAAMGNAGAIAQWIEPDGNALVHESAWRGPRRLHAVFTTEAVFDQTAVVPVPRARRWMFRHITPLAGLIRLRLANGKTVRLRTIADTGWRLVRQATTGDQYPTESQKDSGASTRQYRIASEMIEELGHAGSVLIVASTRPEAQRVASALAEGLPELPALTPIVDFIQGQLGPDHPLIATLRRGVGFHHAGLPTEVQETLEEAVRSDLLPYLTCTSTLTDGINLPVRTVVIYDQGAYPGQPEDVRLRGARLVNAIGRAGRAGKETEGWIVLTRAAAPSENDFTDLNPDPGTLAVTSSLATDEALNQLAAFEAAARDDEDLLFRTSEAAATSFISFVWMMLATEEGRGVAPDDVDIAAIVDTTLAAQTPDARPQFLAIAEAVRNQYCNADSAARRRWPRTGTSIGSARTIDSLATSLVTTIAERIEQGLTDNRADPDFLLGFPGVLQTLLALSEAPAWTLATAADAAVDPAAVLQDWLAGVPLAELGETHLAGAGTTASRVEQMVDAVTAHFEHFLSWTVGAVVELVNVRLSLTGIDDLVCPELGGYIRYGVKDPKALILMTSGVRSRRLAHAISGDLPDEFDSNIENLRLHLAAMGVTEWRDRYAATASELLDLLEFARVRRRSLLRALLENGTVDVELPAITAPGTAGARLTLEPARDTPPPAPLAVYDGDDQVATVASQDQADLAEILNTGVGVRLAINLESEPAILTITLTVGDSE